MAATRPRPTVWIVTTICGALLVLVAVALPNWLDRPLWDANAVQFEDENGDALAGTYVAGDLDAGVLLLEGFGSDQVGMRSAASEFAQLGYHVFTFDFSGHGRSPGTLGYDNAASPRLARQASAALDAFSTRSGVPPARVIMFGHSLGARVALQAATEDGAIGGLVLLGTQVNLTTNTQAELFTGVSDADLAWVQALGPATPQTNILLVSGEWDDILTPEAAALLATKLNGAPLAPNSGAGAFTDGTRRDFLLFPRMLHNYEPFSARALSAGTAWAAEALSLPAPPPVTVAPIRVACWLVGYAGFLLLLIGAAGWIRRARPLATRRTYHVHIGRMTRFLSGKLLLWLGALPLGALLAGLFFFLPIGLPTFNLIYVAVFGGYGVLLVGLYRFGRMPGTNGRLPFADPVPIPWRDIGLTVGATAAILLLTAAYARTGWYHVYPFNTRLLWLVLFTLPTALGFWIGIYEIGMLDRAAPGNGLLQIVALLIGILPFFLYTGFLAAIGSLSGVVGGVQGLLILALALAFGYLLRQISRAHWLTAVCQALLLYWLILPQGVLFS